MRMAYLLVALFILVLSCKKSQVEKVLSKQVIGTWELVSSEGGFVGRISYPPGNGHIVAFLAGSVIEYKYHDSLLFKGTYSFGRKDDCYPSDKHIILKTSQDPTWYTFIEIKEGQLSLASPNCVSDGATDYYRRLF